MSKTKRLQYEKYKRARSIVTSLRFQSWLQEANLVEPVVFFCRPNEIYGKKRHDIMKNEGMKSMVDKIKKNFLEC